MSAIDNMNDIEKNRVQYVQQMEQTLSHLTKEYEKFKGLAEKWEPRITTEMNSTAQTVKIGLQFGGKYVHATLTFKALQETDLTTAVSAVADALIESLVVEQLRSVIAPKLDEAMKNAKSIKGAGTW